MGIYGSNFNYGQSPFYKDDGLVILQDEIFQYLPNWNYPVRLAYTFETIISSTRLNYEQRKPLRAQPRRLETFSITENDIYERIWNYFVQRHAESFFVPVFSEPLLFQGSGDMVGVTSAVVRKSFEWYFNLRALTTYLLLIDLKENVDSEIIGLTGFTGFTGIQFTAIAGHFIRESTVCFPVFRSYLSSKVRQDITDKMTLMDLEFTEIEIDL